MGRSVCHCGPLKQIGVSWRLGVVLLVGLAAVCIGLCVAEERTWPAIWSDRVSVPAGVPATAQLQHMPANRR